MLAGIGVQADFLVILVAHLLFGLHRSACPKDLLSYLLGFVVIMFLSPLLPPVGALRLFRQQLAIVVNTRREPVLNPEKPLGTGCPWANHSVSLT